MDGAGPPPMASDTISAIPSVKIDQKVLEKNANCAVCFEDFSLGEEARLLECGHCFHTDCIVPWLELHGTCPVCRKARTNILLKLVLYTCTVQQYNSAGVQEEDEKYSF